MCSLYYLINIRLIKIHLHFEHSHNFSENFISGSFKARVFVFRDISVYDIYFKSMCQGLKGSVYHN